MTHILLVKVANPFMNRSLRPEMGKVFLCGVKRLGARSGIYSTKATQPAIGRHFPKDNTWPDAGCAERQTPTALREKFLQSLR